MAGMLHLIPCLMKPYCGFKLLVISKNFLIKPNPYGVRLFIYDLKGVTTSDQGVIQIQESIKYLADNLSQLKEYLNKSERKELLRIIQGNLFEQDPGNIQGNQVRRFNCFAVINSKRINVDISIFNNQTNAWVTIVDFLTPRNKGYANITI